MYRVGAGGLVLAFGGGSHDTVTCEASATACTPEGTSAHRKMFVDGIDSGSWFGATPLTTGSDVLVVESSAGVGASEESLRVDDGDGLIEPLGVIDTAEPGGVLVSSRHNSGNSGVEAVELRAGELSSETVLENVGAMPATGIGVTPKFTALATLVAATKRTIWS